MTNHRYAFLRDLELKGRLLDAGDKTLARETIADFPTYIPSGKSEPFQMNLRLPEGSTPVRLRFNYTYLLAEEPPAVRGMVDTTAFRISVRSTHRCDGDPHGVRTDVLLFAGIPWQYI